MVVNFWQEIYNDKNELVEIHEKYPIDKGHVSIQKEGKYMHTTLEMNLSHRFLELFSKLQELNPAIDKINENSREKKKEHIFFNVFLNK